MTSRRKVQALTPAKELARLLLSFGHGRHRIDSVFRDWIEMAALAISNSVDLAQHVAREERYMSMIKHYTSDEQLTLSQMLAYLVMALEETGECILTRLIAELELQSKSAQRWLGQVFTPWSVCKMMATTLLAPTEDLRNQIADRGFITVMEPACGAGTMLLAFAEAFQEQGFNFQTQMHATGVDIDPMCAHMAYVQLSLLGIPACIIQGDSLRMTQAAVWYTPFHVLRGWDRRLRGEASLPDAPGASTLEAPSATFEEAVSMASGLMRDVVTGDLPGVPPETARSLLAGPPPLRFRPWRVATPAGLQPPFDI